MRLTCYPWYHVCLLGFNISSISKKKKRFELNVWIWFVDLFDKVVENLESLSWNPYKSVKQPMPKIFRPHQNSLRSNELEFINSPRRRNDVDIRMSFRVHKIITRKWTNHYFLPYMHILWNLVWTPAQSIILIAILE